MFRIIHLPTATLVRFCGSLAKDGKEYFPLMGTKSLEAATNTLNTATFFESLKGTPEPKILYICAGMLPIHMEVIPRYHLEIIEVPDV